MTVEQDAVQPSSIIKAKKESHQERLKAVVGTSITYNWLSMAVVEILLRSFKTL